MDLEIIAKILNTGVTGFAFLMLFLGFRLTSQVQAKILDHKTSDFKDVEMYREWKELIAAQLSNTRYFLIFSLIFFAGGLFLLVYEAKNELKMVMSPKKLPFIPSVYIDGDEMDFEQRHSLPLLVKDGQNIRVSYEEPLKTIRELKASLSLKKDLAQKTMVKTAKESGDSGW
jgi:hypothetical protein